MSLIHAVDLAIRQGRTFRLLQQKEQGCSLTFEAFLMECPHLFTDIDNQLFDGAITQFFKDQNIIFEIVASKTGPAGLTTFTNTPRNYMCVALRRDAWQTSLPAFVGGNLCNTSDGCLRDVFVHEIIHVLLFSIYLQIDMSPEDVESLIPYSYDPTHNILFTVWLAKFFGQHTINNSLLLCGTHEALTFNRDMQETERVCIHDSKKSITIFRNGQKEPATLVKSNTFYDAAQPKLKPHHSHVRTRSGTLLTVPNGLIFC